MYIAVGYDVLAEAVFRKQHRTILEQAITDRFAVPVSGSFSMNRNPDLAVRGVLSAITGVG